MNSLVLAKNTIQKNYFWIYPNTYEYDTALAPPTEYEYDRDIIQYGGQRIQIYLDTLNHSFGHLGLQLARVR
jgi:hypothetical protein